MPVKIENSSKLSISPFDAMSIFNNTDIFCEDGEQTDLTMTISNTAFPTFVSSDDLWDSPEFSYSFIQTPPQSPSLQSDSLTSNTEDKALVCKNTQDILTHDCMWSGVCQDNFCREKINQRCSVNVSRPETPFNLSISPQNSYGYTSCDMSDNNDFTEENTSYFPYSVFQQSQVNGNSNCNEYSHMDNDHSYDTSATVQNNSAQQIQQFGRNNLIKKSQQHSNNNSLLKKRCPEKINQNRISKFKYSKRVASQKKKATNSILNSPTRTTTTNSSKFTKLEKDVNLNSTTNNRNTIINNNNSNNNNSNNNNILKPTIISVATLKKMPDSFHTKYKVSTKRRQKLIESALPKIVEEEIINDVIVSRTKKQITTSLINEIVESINHSPVCSDSEDNCSSSLSSGDNVNDKLNQPPIKRREHNDSERKRRDHLRNSFNNLKDQIPKLKVSQKRPPRIMILHEATTYVTELTDRNTELQNTFQKELEKRKRLLELLKIAQQKALA